MIVALVLVGCFAGFLASSTTGIGGALVMMPLLVLIVPAPTAVAMSTPVMLVNNLGKLLLLRGSLDWLFLRRTMIGAVPGAIAGSLLLGVISESVVRRGIGLFLVGYVGMSALAPRRLPEIGRLGVVGWGAVTGFISGLIGAAGPTNAAAMRGYGLDRTAMVATGAAISVAVQLVKLPVFAAVGLIRVPDFPLLLALCAVALLAAYAGRTLLRRIAAHTFERLLLAVLLFVGLWMLWG